MIIDDIKQKLKDLEPTVQIIKNYWTTAQLEKQFIETTDLSNQETFWQHPDKTAILQKLQQLKIKRESYQEIIHIYEEIKELIILFETDEQELVKINQECTILSKKTKAFKTNINITKLIIMVIPLKLL